MPETLVKYVGLPTRSAPPSKSIFLCPCLSQPVYQAGCTVYAFPCLPYLAYITLDLNPASWAASVSQLAEHWTSNPVVTGSNPVRGSSVFFSLSAFRLCLTLFCLPLHIHVQDLIMNDSSKVGNLNSGENAVILKFVCTCRL